MTVIIHTGGEPGSQYWVDESGHFTNQDRVEEDSDFVAAGDIDPAGAGDALVLLAKRNLPVVVPDVESFNLLALQNGSHGTVVRFTPDGHLVLLPNPTTGEYIWDDLVSDGALVIAGASLPPIEVYRGGIEMRHWAIGDQGNLNHHFKHRYVPGSPAYVHIHGKLRTGTTGAQAKIKFELEYIKGQMNEVDTAPVTVSKEFDISDLAQYTEVYLGFEAITMTGYLESSNLTVRLRRIAASANEYGDKLAIPQIDCHIQHEKGGTRYQLPPYGK